MLLRQVRAHDAEHVECARAWRLWFEGAFFEARWSYAALAKAGVWFKNINFADGLQNRRRENTSAESAPR